jgi:hypothetical protein
VAVGDLDGVNGLDLAVANFHSDDVWVLLNQGDATFAPATASWASWTSSTCCVTGVRVPSDP